ncbi:unnamed protein product [Rotaria sp. Silwood2]|nr:unnamed protein product [Rotaria sp. Silwood2]CAF4262854.1 unnamed protein product [Rotaria sp. Silwood2]
MNTSLLTKDRIVQLIKDNDPNITFSKPKSSSSSSSSSSTSTSSRTSSSSSSQVWSSFSYVYFKNHKQNFVCCDVCKDIFAHTSSNGTSSMAKHQKSCSKVIKNNDEHRITACTEFVVLDNRPFHMITGEGFVNFAQNIFDVDRNSQLQFHNFILGCYPYDRESHSANQVRQFVDSKLAEYHLILDSQTFVVTDNENLMKSTFKDCIRIGCSIHYLNKQLEHSFTTKEIDKVAVNCDIVQEMFSCIRKIVAHVRRSHKQCQLSHKLQSYSDTRFNGAFFTMDIFLLVFDEIITVLESSLINNYLFINKELLECVCLFLKVFEEVIRELSQDTVPTIHKVLPLREYLLNHCQINSNDSDGIKELKIFLELRIKNVWTLHEVHYITSFLHPSFKNFDINPDLKSIAIDLVKNEIRKQHLSINNNDSSNTTTLPIHISTTNSQLKLSSNLLSKCFDAPRTYEKPPLAPYDELVEYMNLNIQLNEKDDVLMFWLENKSKFPILTSMVQKYFAIPASNTIVERLFSSSKTTLSDTHTKLDSEKVNKLLFLQKNLSKLINLSKSSIIESVDVQQKRKLAEQSTSGTSMQDDKLIATSVTKKIKVPKQMNVIFCDEDSKEDKENDVNEFF